MSPTSIIPAIVALCAALMSTYLIARYLQEASPSAQGRFATIDGLRGYLAFFVFLHHSSIWYFYLREGQWVEPPSKLYTHFGQDGVAFFFMITGFLFFSKIFDGKSKGIDWGRLFVSRLLRLVPLYLFAVTLVFLVVAILSKGVLNEPLPALIKHMVYWAGFTVLGAPNLNGIDHTFTIIAGVTWTLRYEWFFYLLLPLFALSVRVAPPMPYIFIGIASAVGLAVWQPEIISILPFAGGIAASFLVRNETFRTFSERSIASFLVIGLIGIEVAFFPSAKGVVQVALLSLAFSLIAGGCGLFKVLMNPLSRAMGELSYSIYLLHGLLLFAVFNFAIGVDVAKDFSAMDHWLVIIGISPVLIFISFCTYRFIERPAMKSTNSVLAWLRSHFNPTTATVQSQRVEISPPYIVGHGAELVFTPSEQDHSSITTENTK